MRKRIIGRRQKKPGWISCAAALLAGCLLYCAARGAADAAPVFISQSAPPTTTGTTTAPGLPEDFLPTADNLHQLQTFDDIKKYLYYIDETAYADETLLDLDGLMAVDTKIKLSGKNEPKILIFHTHSQEDFIDSKPGEEADTIVGAGSVLADILARDYGVGVVHDFGQYDVVGGENVRGESYERMAPNVRKILAKYPSVEVMIDLHRDGVPANTRLVTEINGETVARLMFFNGILCERVGERGQPVANLPNPYLKENLAMSLKMQLTANERYPGFTRMLYLKPYRYSLHMRPKSLLVEAGANTNTVDEVKKAMAPLAEILYAVIQ
ncbi:MAG: stage II sporulation protein P [Clostridiales bacterium]|nr:stage II sporulation protein P [Clostridiales bacterium]